MREYCVRYKSLYLRETLGFALFLAWVFCSLFGCGLASYENSPVGVTTVYNLEHVWMVSGLFEALGGLAGIVAARFHPAPDRLLHGRTVGVLALLCAVAGNYVTMVAWADFPGLFWQLYPVGGALTGLAIALFVALWGARLGSYDEAYTEFAVPLSFTLAFALYFVLLLTKQGHEPFFIALAVMIAASAFFAVRGRADSAAPACTARRDAPWTDGRQGLLSFAVLVVVSWVQVAFFRIISTPELTGDRFTHYLLPFSFACVLSLVMFLLCLRMSRYLNISLAYRWSLPLFMLSYLPLFADYGNPELRMLAYAINFLGMFGVQFGCWIGICKHLHRSNGGALRLFGTYALAEGIGIFAGCIIGLYVMGSMDEHGMMQVSIGLMAAVIFAAMVTGFNPTWVFSRPSEGHATQGSDPLEGTSGAGRPDAPPCLQEARTLQAAYGLTNRETDVAVLLLEGRSRPFIRDELVVSINTVSTHVRSIFAKCGVHSQQELMVLARNARSANED
ncbi:response regulator transcription factor [Gordonibacter sp. RACS_AR49]|uniref:response regulator transcription factor n=1 Tax=Gordonibacter sp. RACS_AR49 TaxID=2871986 RepID=UPI00261A9DF5|nr:helix-turn-helix transcriptional regulator [Gordonibacter sp. RACS_AR49]MDN4510827.1 helix-turn-helix transcriptional regulator [Gordonibacter sp. RACS_AR49]